MPKISDVTTFLKMKKLKCVTLFSYEHKKNQKTWLPTGSLIKENSNFVGN